MLYEDKKLQTPTKPVYPGPLLPDGRLSPLNHYIKDGHYCSAYPFSVPSKKKRICLLQWVDMEA